VSIIVTYEVVGSDGKPVHNVAVKENEKVILSLNAEDVPNRNYVSTTSGRIDDLIGPEPGQPLGNAFLHTEQTFTVRKDGETIGLSTKIDQYILEENGRVTAAAEIQIP
jgi:hypothetical protein